MPLISPLMPEPETTGTLKRTKLKSNCHQQHSNIQFLQAGCSSVTKSTTSKHRRSSNARKHSREMAYSEQERKMASWMGW